MNPFRLRRPKSDGRCIHCREVLANRTKDHVFSRSWYPNSTPPNIERWTVPSCRRCNGEYGALENELFVRLALCLDPTKAAASGLADKALRSYGVKTAALSESERRVRQSLLEQIRRELKPVTPENQKHVLPGLGPHPEVPAERQFQIAVPADKLERVLRKVVRGCEYWLSNGRIIEADWEISIHFIHEGDVPDLVRQAISSSAPAHLGPGLQIQRAAAQDGSNVVIYRMLVWGALRYYAIILPAEPIASN